MSNWNNLARFTAFLIDGFDHKNNKICFPDSKNKQWRVPKGYLMFGPNHILVTLRWDDERSPGHGNVCRWFLNICKPGITLLGPSKLRNHFFLEKCSKMNLNFQIWSKLLYFRCDRANKMVGWSEYSILFV